MAFILRYWMGFVDDSDADEVQRRYPEQMWCAHSSRIVCLYMFSHEHVCVLGLHMQMQMHVQVALKSKDGILKLAGATRIARRITPICVLLPWACKFFNVMKSKPCML